MSHDRIVSKPEADHAPPGQRTIDTATGEVTQECPTCAELAKNVARQEAEIAGLQRDIRGWAYRYDQLRRDLEAEAREHDLYDTALDLFAYWREATGRKGCRFSADRFYMVLPYLQKDGVERCQQAIDGRVADHYTAQRKNGSTIHYHEWERIFGKRRSDFEESCNRAPIPYRPKRAIRT